jgi:rare lipoprotein A
MAPRRRIAALEHPMMRQAALRAMWVGGVMWLCHAAWVGAADLPPPPGMPRSPQSGLAGIVHDRLEGHTTASGELYNRNALTAAHRFLPYGTIVRVTNVQNHRSVIVRINDRAPAVGSRVIDLTPRAASAIGLIGISVAEVKLEVIGQSAVRLTPSAAPADVPADAPTEPPVK